MRKCPWCGYEDMWGRDVCIACGRGEGSDYFTSGTDTIAEATIGEPPAEWQGFKPLKGG